MELWNLRGFQVPVGFHTIWNLINFFIRKELRVWKGSGLQFLRIR